MNTLLILAPLGAPLLAALAYVALGWRRATTHAGTCAAALILADGIALAVRVLGRGPIDVTGGWLRADALSAFMLMGIGTIALLACAASPAYLAAGHHAAPATPGESAKPELRATRAHQRYGVLVQLFLTVMATAVLAGNLGLAWIAIEATIVVTAFLVGHADTREALEAAWKYTVIRSTGIALALLGIVVLYDAARHAGLAETDALSYQALSTHAHALDPAVTRMGVAFILLGFGAKAGLAPLHAWLPDAHSQAPTPVSALSALMSGCCCPSRSPRSCASRPSRTPLSAPGTPEPCC
jgi:hydrogenase-4 component F